MIRQEPASTFTYIDLPVVMYGSAEVIPFWCKKKCCKKYKKPGKKRCKNCPKKHAH